jgi:hypothetical protein
MTTDIRFYPLAGCIGARVEGVDFNQVVSDETIAQIRQGLDQYMAPDIQNLVPANGSLRIFLV